jgi:hypothetical protein
MAKLIELERSGLINKIRELQVENLELRRRLIDIRETANVYTLKCRRKK